jgi:ABC-2 type transport system permease protein
MMIVIIRHALAFLRRSAKEQLSYGVATAMEIAAVFLSLGMYFFLAKLVDASASPLLNVEGRGGYFAFVTTGIGMSSVLAFSVRGLVDEVRRGQLTGTLEVVFGMPIAPWEVVVWPSLWSFVRSTSKLAVYVAGGALLGMPLVHANWPSAALAVLMSLLGLLPLGIVAAAFVLVFKRGDPFSLLLGAAAMFLGGVYFPIELLPGPMRVVAQLFPLTHAVTALRGALLDGRSPAELWRSLAALAAFAAIGGPLAIALFNRAVRTAKMNGALGSY